MKKPHNFFSKKQKPHNFFSKKQKPHNFFSKKQKPHNFFFHFTQFLKFSIEKPYFKNSKRNSHILFFIDKLSLYKMYHALSYLRTLKISIENYRPCYWRDLILPFLIFGKFAGLIWFLCLEKIKCGFFYWKKNFMVFFLGIFKICFFL